MDYTNNLHLPQFAETDRIHHDDFNDAFAAIDTAVTANSTAITALDSAKATAADLSAETAARQNADTALSGRIDSEAAARAAADAAIHANLGSHGHNLRIASGTYNGTGTGGSGNPSSLSFDFKPMAVFISTSDGGQLGNAWMIRPITITYAVAGELNYNDKNYVTWGERSVSWYTTTTGSGRDYYQGNHTGYTYHWIALGYDDSED